MIVTALCVMTAVISGITGAVLISTIHYQVHVLTNRSVHLVWLLTIVTLIVINGSEI